MRTMLKVQMLLDPCLELNHAYRFCESHDSALAAKVFDRNANVSHLTRAVLAAAHAGCKPVVDAALDTVERCMRRVHGHAGGGEAEQRALQRVRKCERGEWLEDCRVV